MQPNVCYTRLNVAVVRSLCRVMVKNLGCDARLFGLNLAPTI